jgi:hypothetical protein
MHPSLLYLLSMECGIPTLPNHQPKHARFGCHCGIPKTQSCQVVIIDWQDRVLDDGVFDNDKGHSRRGGPPVNRDNRVLPELTQRQSQPTTTSEGGLSFGTHGLEPLTSSEKSLLIYWQRPMRYYHGRLVSWRGQAGLAQRKRI